MMQHHSSLKSGQRYGVVLGTAFFLMVICTLGQLLFGPDPELLGQADGGTSSKLVGLYPWLSISQVLRICSVVFPFFLLLSACLFSKPLSRRDSHAKITAIGLLTFTYILLLVSHMILVPALYETYLSNQIKRLIFQSSFFLNPYQLQLAAGFAFVLSLAFFSTLVSNFWKCALILLTLILAAVNRPQFGNQLPRMTLDGDIQTKPHMLIISIDSLRLDRMDNPLICPNINKLKAELETTSFNNHHVGVPRTFPSWVELLQGRYSIQTGIRHMFPDLSLRRRANSEAIRSLNERGYESFVVSDFAGDIFTRFTHGLSKIDTPRLSIQSLIKLGVVLALPLYLPFTSAASLDDFMPDLRESANFALADRLTKRTLNHISSVKSSEKPFFGIVFFSTAHFPYAAPWPFYKTFSDDSYKGPYYFQKNPNLKGDSHKVTSEDIDQIRSLYNGAVKSIDLQVGRIISELKAAGLYDNTIIILTADHGENLYERSLGQGHGDHLRGEHSLRVPWLIKGLKSLGPTTRNINFVTRSIDVMPTIFATASLDPAKTFEGVDLSPWIYGAKKDAALREPTLTAYSETGLWFAATGKESYQQKRIEYPGIANLLSIHQGRFSEITLNSQHSDTIVTAKNRSLVLGDHKLIYSPGQTNPQYKLFNRRMDPDNILDLSVTNHDKYQKMKQMLIELIARNELDFRYQNGYWVPK